MTAIEHVQEMIRKLSPQERAELRVWLLEHGAIAEAKGSQRENEGDTGP